MNELNILINKIKEANVAYRTGEAIISDAEWDALITELSLLDPDNDLLNNIGYEVISNTRKAQLPIPMYSMNKLKTSKEIADYTRLKNIPSNTEIVLTPKLDGLSFVVIEDTEEAFTRGDGKIGQRSNEHYKLISNHLTKSNIFKYTYGEVIMSKKIFNDKYSDKFANPRNLVAGLLNCDDVSESLKDCQYIKYGGIPNDNTITKKSELLDKLNNGQVVKIPYYICTITDLNDDMLIQFYEKWKNEYEIDGIIFEVNDLKLQEKLGRETNNNPAYARAYKNSIFSESLETEIIDIEWTISKQGLLKPVGILKPINLDGVTVSRVTLCNARYCQDLNIGIGSRVKITRSGQVIPKVIQVIHSGNGFEIPTIEGVELKWNDNKVELMTVDVTDAQQLKRISAFFEILGAENFSEGVITQLWNSGYRTIKDILLLSEKDLLKIEGFGERKAEIVFNAIRKCVKDVEISKLKHASGIFNGLGSKKLVLLDNLEGKPKMEDILKIEGFAEISAKTYIDNYDAFTQFMEEISPLITIKSKKVIENISNEYSGRVYVYTGVRDAESQSLLESKGAKITSSVSKNTTHLICKSKDSSSSKFQKALDFGATILSLDELRAELGL